MHLDLRDNKKGCGCEKEEKPPNRIEKRHKKKNRRIEPIFQSNKKLIGNVILRCDNRF